MTSGLKQQSAGIADKATTGAQAHTRDPRQTTWAKASVWTERMLSALGNGVVVPKARASIATAANGTV